MLIAFVVVGLLLGPLLLARAAQLKPSPGGIVVSPTAPLLDMEIVIDSSPDDPIVKPLIASITGQRPQPASLIVEVGATPTGKHAVTVEIEPQVVLASPEALDRIAAALDETPSIAMYPWQKTSSRVEALSTFFVLASTMTNGAFGLVGTKARRFPAGLRARRAGATGDPTVLRGGYMVAERRYPNGLREIVDGWTERVASARAADPLALLLTILFFAAITIAAVRFVSGPSWATFGLYAPAVFAISVCIRQVGRFARLATAIYPVTLAFFFVLTLRASLSMRGQRARAARASR